jgi:hypothetical protein
MATRRLGRGLVGVFAVHDTISNQNPSCYNDVVPEHYGRVAGSLTFGKISPDSKRLSGTGQHQVSSKADADDGTLVERVELAIAN